MLSVHNVNVSLSFVEEQKSQSSIEDETQEVKPPKKPLSKHLLSNCSEKQIEQMIAIMQTDEQKTYTAKRLRLLFEPVQEKSFEQVTDKLNRQFETDITAATHL